MQLDEISQLLIQRWCRNVRYLGRFAHIHVGLMLRVAATYSNTNIMILPNIVRNTYFQDPEESPRLSGITAYGWMYRPAHLRQQRLRNSCSTRDGPPPEGSAANKNNAHKQAASDFDTGLAHSAEMKVYAAE